VKPRSFQFPKGDHAKVKYYDDGEKGGRFGYLKVTIDNNKPSLTCKLMGVTDGKTKALDSHKILI
jgi:hypothetical protein